MKKINILLLLRCAMFLSSCSSLSIPTFSTNTPTLTVTPPLTPTEIPVVSKTPTSTLTPLPTKTPTLTFTPLPIITIEPYSKSFPKEWHLAPLSDGQITQVKECDFEKLANDRYPKQKDINELIYLFDPQTSCDWAVLAFAYTDRVNEDEKLPDIAKNAFAKAIADNPGFAFSTPLFYRFFSDAFPIVKQPPLSEQDITRVKIEYEWTGIGDSVKYVVDIRKADTHPIILLTNYEPATVNQNLKKTIDKEFIQTLGKSLSNLLPIESQFSLVPCYDNSPDWTVMISQKDGTRLVLKTNGSNMIYIGGPWQTNIDGQDYLQYSVEFIAALNKLIKELGLPYGQPAAMYCAPESVLDKVYP